MTISRRDALIGAGAAAALAASGTAHAKTKKRPATTRPLAPGKHEVVALRFDPAKLTGISKEMISSHHDNNYAGAVKNLNKVELELAAVTKDTPGFTVFGLRERELTYTNSLILHEHYFGNLGGDGKRAGEIERALAASFGSTATWEEQFRATAMSLGGGSGWAILDFNFHTGDLRTYWAGGHANAVAFGQPLLVLDMYEHAYALDYGAGHARYVDAFFANIAWDEVDRRLSAARKAHEAMRA